MAMNASSTDIGGHIRASASRLHGDIVNRHNTHEPASPLNDRQPSNSPHFHRLERRAHIVVRCARVQRFRNELLRRNLSLGARPSRCGDANIAIRNDPDHVVALVSHGDHSTVSFPHDFRDRGKVRFQAAAFHVSRHQIFHFHGTTPLVVAEQFLRVTGVTVQEETRDTSLERHSLSAQADRGQRSIGCSRKYSQPTCRVARRRGVRAAL